MKQKIIFGLITILLLNLTIPAFAYNVIWKLLSPEHSLYLETNSITYENFIARYIIKYKTDKNKILMAKIMSDCSSNKAAILSTVPYQNYNENSINSEDFDRQVYEPQMKAISPASTIYKAHNYVCEPIKASYNTPMVPSQNYTEQNSPKNNVAQTLFGILNEIITYPTY